MIKIIKFIILALFGAFLLQSCEYEWIEPLDQEMPEVISYSNHIQPIFDKSCNTSGCHDNGGPPPNLIADKSYNALMTGGYVNQEDPESSTIYTSIKFGSMQTYAQPGDAEYILEWIKQGAKNN